MAAQLTAASKDMDQADEVPEEEQEVVLDDTNLGAETKI